MFNYKYPTCLNFLKFELHMPLILQKHDCFVFSQICPPPFESSLLSNDLSRLLLDCLSWVNFDMAKDGATGVLDFDYNILHISCSS